MPALISRRFPGLLAGIVLIAAVLRGAFPTADPPWRTTVGVVWHDEGAWVHNARNRALFGAWRVDEWNPLFIAPVFTGFEYLSFRTFGVGLWQARVVSEVAGVISVVLLSLGVRRLAGDLAAIIAAALVLLDSGRGPPMVGRAGRSPGHPGVLHQGGGHLLRCSRGRCSDLDSRGLFRSGGSRSGG